MFKIVFVITIVSFGIQLKAKPPSKMGDQPRSLSGKINKDVQKKSSLSGTSIHKTNLKKTPQPRKLGSLIDNVSKSFKSIIPETYTNGNDEEIKMEDSPMNSIRPDQILDGMPTLDLTKKDSIQAFADTLADHEIAKVEQIMEKLGVSEETNPETMITIENVCDQLKMSSVDEWTIDYFTQFFMESATCMHTTGLNLKISIFKHLSRVESYRLVVQTYNLQILQRFTVVYLTARVMMILKAAGGFIGLKVKFKSFTIDKVRPKDNQVATFLDELKKKMFRPDLIETTFKDFKFRVENLQMDTMENYYKKHFTEKDGKGGVDTFYLDTIKMGRDDQVVNGVCGLVITFIKLIVTDTPAQKKFLDAFTTKTPVPMQYIKNFLQTFGRLFVPDLDDFGNPIKEQKSWTGDKKVGFFRENCYSMDAKDLEKDLSEKKLDEARVKFVNVFSLLTFIIFGKDLNTKVAPFLARNFFSRTYMLNVMENTDAELLLIIQKDMFLLFTELKAEADFWEFFESAKSFKTDFIFHIQFYNDFLVVPVEVNGKIALFSDAYGKPEIYPSFWALTLESSNQNAKDAARNMYMILNNIYLIYSYMKVDKSMPFKSIPFDGDVKLVYHAIIKFLLNPTNVQAYYNSEIVKDKTIAEYYLDVLTYLCYKTGGDCSEYSKQEFKVPETIKILTETLNFKMTITILISYKTIFKTYILMNKLNTMLKETRDKFNQLTLKKIIWKCRNLVDSADADCKGHVEIYTKWLEIFKGMFKEEFLAFSRRSFELVLTYKHPTLGEETTRVFMIYILKYVYEEKKNIQKITAVQKKVLGIILKTLLPIMRSQYSSFLSDKIHYNFLFFLYRLFETVPKLQEFKRNFKITQEFEYVDIKTILFHVVAPKLSQPDKAPILPEHKRTMTGAGKINQERFQNYVSVILKVIVNMKNKMNLEPGAPKKTDKEAIDQWKAEFKLQPPPENDNNPDPELYIKWIEVYTKLSMYAQIFRFFDVFQADNQKLESLLGYQSQNFMNVFYNYFIIVSHSIASGVSDIYDFQEYIYEKMNACMIASAQDQPNPEMMAICHNLSHRKWAELYYFVKYMYVVINGTPGISVLDYYDNNEPITNARVFISIAQTLDFTVTMTSFCTDDLKKIQVLCMAFGILDIVKSHIQSTSQKSLSVEEVNDKIYDDYGGDKSPEAIKKLQTALLIVSDTLKYYSESKIETSRFEAFFDYTRAETLFAVSSNPQIKAFINKKHEFYDKKVFIMQANDELSKKFLTSYLRRTFVKYVKDPNEEPIQLAVNKLLESKPQIIERFFVTTNLPDFHYLKPILQYTDSNNYNKMAELMINNNIFLQIPSMNDPKTDALWIPLIEYVGCTTYANVAAYEDARKKNNPKSGKSNFPCQYKVNAGDSIVYLKRLLEYISIKGRLHKLDSDLEIEQFNEDITKSDIVKEQIESHQIITDEIKTIEQDANKVLEENRKTIDSMVKTASMKSIVSKQESFVKTEVITEQKSKTQIAKLTFEFEFGCEDRAPTEEELNEMREMFKQQALKRGKVINMQFKDMKISEVPQSKVLDSIGSTVFSQPRNSLTNIEEVQEQTNIIDEELRNQGSTIKISSSTKSFSNSFKTEVTKHMSRSQSFKSINI